MTGTARPFAMANGDAPQGRALSPYLWAFIFAALIVFSNAFIMLISLEGDVTAIYEGSREFRVVSAAIYLVVILLSLRLRKQIVNLLRQVPLLLAIVALVALSITWSADPDLTIQRTVALMLTVVFAAFLCCAANAGQLLTLLSTSLATLVLSSLLMAIVVPEIAVHTVDHFQGAWRGVFMQKNQLGETMGLMLVLLAGLAYDAQRRQIRGWRLHALAAAALFVLAMSTSRTPWLTVGATCAVLYLVSRLRDRRKVSQLLLGIVAASLALPWMALFFAINQIDPFNLFAFLGKDVTLTGRTTLWLDIWPLILERIWLGHGFGGFFSIDAVDLIWLWEATGWRPATAHNALVQLVLDLGLLGAIVFLMLLAQTAARLATYHSRRRDAVSFAFVAMFIYVLIKSVEGGDYLARNNIFFIVHLLILLVSSRAISGARTHSAASWPGSCSPRLAHQACVSR